MSKKILIVDDSLYMRTMIREALEEGGYEIAGEADNGEKAIDLALSLQPDLITLDNILPDMLGLDVLKVIKKEAISAKVVIISAVGQQSVVDEGMKLGADHYIIKPFTSEKLLEIIQEIVPA